MARDPELTAHLEWLGYIQPVGLVVSAPALLQAQAHVNSNVIPQHQRFLACLPVDKDDEVIPQIEDFPAFVRQVLDWSETDLVAFDDAHKFGIDVSGLEVVLPEYNETLRPTWIVPEFKSAGAKSSPPTDSSATTSAEPKLPSNADRFVMLIQQVPTDQDLDEPQEDTDRRWHASPHARFERLLRETQVPAGLLINGRQLRLVYAPRGETSGYLTFNVDEMVSVAGRPMFAALHMLLNSDRLFNLEKKQRLPSILVESRKYQNIVSTQLAQQVMAAMYELLRGFQAADDQWNGKLLRDVLASNPQHVYHGLLTILMRSVFILYAEDRNLLSNHPVYTNYYSITGLFERLRADAGQYPDTMDQRYGAWAQLLTLFRMIYLGGKHGEFSIPPRKGYLFDPDRYPFLAGLGDGDATSNDFVSERRADFLTTKPIASPSSTIPQPQVPSPQLTSNPKPLIPRVSDGVIYRVLNNLLILDGERLSYRSLDVEQIGSVYEAIMGFEVEVSKGLSIAVKPVKKHGAPATINLEELLKQKAADRAKWLKERSDQSVTGQALEALKSARTIEDLLAALDKKIDNLVTPNVVPSGAMIFQPSDERRRSGSHYTPRSLTEPIVRTTLVPILQQLVDPVTELPEVYEPSPEDKKRYTKSELAEKLRRSRQRLEVAEIARSIGAPSPEQILALKVCDPAMGSGAFLVEACRQLGDELVKAWHFHNCVPKLPPDEDEVLHARRLIAQHCLYGVDKNPMAVDLSKLSLWLATLAKDHPFTFLDHSLRAGDSLVGLSREQIAAFHWQPPAKRSQDDVWFGDPIAERMRTVTEYRQRILAARDDKPYEQLRQELDVADEALSLARLTGDCVIAAYFSAGKDRERVAKLDTLARQLVQYLGPQRRIEDRQPLTEAVASLHGGDHPLQPFHWQIEFPEVFTVDAKGKPTGGFDAMVGNPPFLGGKRISGSLGKTYSESVCGAHPESNGNADLVAHFFRRAFGLLRACGCFGLIATNTIAQGDTRRSGLRWIGNHGGTIFGATRRLRWPGEAAVVVSVVRVAKTLDAVECTLDGNNVRFISAFLFGGGTHDDPTVLSANKDNAFIGCDIKGQGFLFDDDDVDASPTSVMEECLREDARNNECIRPYLGGAELNDSPTQRYSRWVICFGEMSEEEATRWPMLFKIVKDRVRPDRLQMSEELAAWPWWRFWRVRNELYARASGLQTVTVCAQTSRTLAFSLLPPSIIFSHKTIVVTWSSYLGFCVLQSGVHQQWAYFFGSTLKDDPVYTPSDCFETFPFPAGVLEHAAGDSPTTDNGPLTTLETAGREYYEFRAALMVRHNEGLTKTYNRFHDPHETSPDILQLRALHAAMDRAVLEAYAWHDLAQTATCEFLLDYEDDEDEDEGSGTRSPGTGRQKKKPWRYRWPDPFRDEVLARLLELNKQRHQEELLTAGAPSAAKKVPKASAKKKAKKSTSVDQLELGLDDGE